MVKKGVQQFIIKVELIRNHNPKLCFITKIYINKENEYND
jgi:hypothetical protein